MSNLDFLFRLIISIAVLILALSNRPLTVDSNTKKIEELQKEVDELKQKQTQFDNRLSIFEWSNIPVSLNGSYQYQRSRWIWPNHDITTD